jgi:hypothetical protein
VALTFEQLGVSISALELMVKLGDNERNVFLLVAACFEEPPI